MGILLTGSTVNTSRGTFEEQRDGVGFVQWKPKATAAGAAGPAARGTVNTQVKAGGRKKSLYLREGDQTFQTRSGYGSQVDTQAPERRQRQARVPGVPGPARATAAGNRIL